MIPAKWLIEADERIAPHIRRTPLTYDTEHDLYLKWENHQVTGSFKARGAFNKVLSLLPWERQQGLITASAGNHGQGVALAGQVTGARVVVFASDHAVPKKLDAMRHFGAEVHLVPGGYGEAEAAGLDYAHRSGAIWVSPYNDGQVIAGQATLALEILGELPEPNGTTWIVPVGGGGLISGIGAALDLKAPAGASIRLVGVQSAASAFMHAIYYRNTQVGVADDPSLADGLSGPVETNSLTIPMVKQYVDELALVSEAEIENALAVCWQRYGERIEGSAAVGLAAILSEKIPQRPAVVVLSGGNIGDEVFDRIVGK